VHLEALCLAQKEGNLGVVNLPSHLFDGGVQKVVQIDHPDDRLVETRRETDGLELLDKAPLGCDQVIAKYIYLLCLPLAVFVKLSGQKTQSSMSLFITHFSSVLF